MEDILFTNASHSSGVLRQKKATSIWINSQKIIIHFVYQLRSFRLALVCWNFRNATRTKPHYVHENPYYAHVDEKFCSENFPLRDFKGRNGMGTFTFSAKPFWSLLRKFMLEILIFEKWIFIEANAFDRMPRAFYLLLLCVLSNKAKFRCAFVFR